MSEVQNLSWDDVNKEAMSIARIMYEEEFYHNHFKIFGVPRGGIHAAQAVRQWVDNNTTSVELVEDVKDANIIIDDITESGKTKEKYPDDIPFFALIEKKEGDPWYSFPWERMKHEMGPEENILRILQYIGEDHRREGLKDTPKRVVKSWDKIFGGYNKSPKDVLTTFKESNCDEMIVLKNIEFYSQCEHHMIPFFGKVHIGYLPNNNEIVGISKLVRLLENFTRRLQIQERIGQQITESLMKYLKPKGCGCVIEAQHLCMTSRGVEKQKSIMVTSSMRGNFLKDMNIRTEFLRMIDK